MLSLDDPKWGELKGGYKVLYDASVPLRKLENGEDVWDELWQELHHQGDVGTASYAAVPQLVRIGKQMENRGCNLYSLISTIEIERHRKSNPAIPDWLSASYGDAMKDLLIICLADLPMTTDSDTIRSILGAIALGKNQLKYGEVLKV